MQVPFVKENELFSTPTTSSSTLPPPGSTQPNSGRLLILPALHEDKDHNLQLINRASWKSYLSNDLNVDGLYKIHKHLWFAGLPRCARPLHYQLMIGRKIIITERADLHLLWHDDRLFLKPLPDYLLSYDTWKESLVTDAVLSENAKGFLLSYLWLIRQKSDFVIAQREHLVSNDLTWGAWTSFSTAIFPNVVSDAFDGISPRYLYSELRLRRVNLIYRLCRKTRNLKTFVRGHFFGYHTYSSFVEQNFAWVLTVIVSITIVLTAMQVGLATTELKDSPLFNRASFGFTVFSIIAPLGILLVLLLVLLFLAIFNLNYTVKQRHSTRRPFATHVDNGALQRHNH